MKNETWQVQLKLDAEGFGTLYILAGGEIIAGLVILKNEKNLIVYHSEISYKTKEDSIKNTVMTTLLNYAEKDELIIIASCAFIRGQLELSQIPNDDILNDNL